MVVFIWNRVPPIPIKIQTTILQRTVRVYRQISIGMHQPYFGFCIPLGVSLFVNVLLAYVCALLWRDAICLFHEWILFCSTGISRWFYDARVWRVLPSHHGCQILHHTVCSRFSYYGKISLYNPPRLAYLNSICATILKLVWFMLNDFVCVLKVSAVIQ